MGDYTAALPYMVANEDPGFRIHILRRARKLTQPEVPTVDRELGRTLKALQTFLGALNLNATDRVAEKVKAAVKVKEQEAQRLIGGLCMDQPIQRLPGDLRTALRAPAPADARGDGASTWR